MFAQFFRDEEEEFELKFDDCGGCKNQKKLRICGECDSGEFFESLDQDGVDDFINKGDAW